MPILIILYTQYKYSYITVLCTSYFCWLRAKICIGGITDYKGRQYDNSLVTCLTQAFYQIHTYFTTIVKWMSSRGDNDNNSIIDLLEVKRPYRSESNEASLKCSATGNVAGGSERAGWTTSARPRDRTLATPPLESPSAWAPCPTLHDKLLYPTRHSHKYTIVSPLFTVITFFRQLSKNYRETNDYCCQVDTKTTV